jgi:hypothetical protein
VWWFDSYLDAREIVKNGGIKGYHGDFIKVIRLLFPDTKIVEDALMNMTIESYDETKGVKMMLWFAMNKDKNLKINGEVIPDPDRWEGLSPKKFSWNLLTFGYDHSDEGRVIFKITRDMVFDPMKENMELHKDL